MHQSKEQNDSAPPLRHEVMASLYRAWDRLAGEEQWACGPGCAACCRNSRILLTRTEGEMMVEAIKAAGRRDLLRRLKRSPDDSVRLPVTTLNQLTRLCRMRQDPPADAGWEGSQRTCALLEHGKCPVYEVRPMACRTLLSRQRCAPEGEASLDSWWVTLGTVFLQLSEAADAGGQYGAMDRMLASVLGKVGEKQGFLTCEPLAGFMVPPEEAEKVQGILDQVFADRIRDKPLGHWLDRIRFTAQSGGLNQL
jgi:Fe-S-cluster containining protein